MITSTKTILKIFSQTALLRANEILNNSQDVNELVDTASREIRSGKKKIQSIRKELILVLSMLKAWAKGDYREIPWTTLLLMAGGVIYFINPFDAVPDMIPAAGLIDDATVIGFIIASTKQDIAKFKAHNMCNQNSVYHSPA